MLALSIGLWPVNTTAQVTATALVGVVAAFIIVRLRHAGGVLRQQLKWLAYAASVLVLGQLAGRDRPHRRAVHVVAVAPTLHR